MLTSRLATLTALSLVCASPASAQPAAVTVYVWSYDFAPKPIYLRAGQPVTLTFVNRSGSSHDFVARSFFASSRVTSGMVMDGMVDLRGRETKSVTLVPRRGTYHAHCSHFLHKQLGMSDTIVVT